MAHWNRVLLQALARKACGQPVPFLWATTDAGNARLIPKSSTRTWDGVVDEAETAYADLWGWVERLGEEELAAADDFAWQEGGPLWQTFLGNTYFHYLGHLANYYASPGRVHQAARSQKEDAGDEVQDVTHQQRLDEQRLAAQPDLPGSFYPHHIHEDNKPTPCAEIAALYSARQPNIDLRPPTLAPGPDRHCQDACETRRDAVQDQEPVRLAPVLRQALHPARKDGIGNSADDDTC